MNIPLRRYWDLLADHIKPQKGRFALLVVLLLGSIGLQIVNPQIVRIFIDAAVAGQAVDRLANEALAFIGIALLQQVVSVSASYVGENVAWTATNALRAELAHHCLHLDMSFHNDASPGELIERIDGDVMELSNFFSQLVVRVIGNLILMLGIVLAVFFEDWRVGVGFAVFSVITLYVMNRVRGLAIPHQKALREANADLFGYLEERLAGTEDIRASGAVDFVILGLYKLMHRIQGHWRRTAGKFVIIQGTAGMLLAVGMVVAFGAGYILFKGGVATIGTVYLLTSYIGLLRRPIRELTQQVENLQNIGASIERLSDLRAIESKIKDGAGAGFSAGPLALRFDGVSFAYKESDPVLQELSFELKPGTVLGLLGRTGSGKTTLARLVFRLYDPTAGRVSLGNVDICAAELQALRQRVAMVTQEVQLFQASVRDNLTFFDRTIPDEQVLAVIEELELTDWYQALPEGLDTSLETGGRDLSAGEAQLLAFARAFLRDPGLVILDEASSRLDPVTEQRIERAVDKLLQNRTAIIIAHRLGTIHRADDVMILSGGQVIEYGDRGRLAADPASRFYGLLQTGLEEWLA
jgi:ABC-type multidrug transport system fused ATPase/permease subunit